MVRYSKFEEWRRRALDPSLSVLFALQILVIFVLGPIDENAHGAHHWMTECALASMSLISIFIVNRPLPRTVILCSLALALLGIAIGFVDTQHAIARPIATVSGLLYCVVVSLVIGRQIFRQGPITTHRIRGAVTIYLNIAIAFALVGKLFSHIWPHAYSVMDADEGLGNMIYFSLTTLTSTGYGDIVPLHPYARSLANLESVVGQFYLATLIATLVSMRAASHQERGNSSS